jgi:hypothetical protein
MEAVMSAIQWEIVLAVLIALGTVSVARSQTDDEASRFAGTWRGVSVCVATDTACHDETVVYRVHKLPTPGHVMVSADKIVSDKAINMGTLGFHYDQHSKSWLCQYPQGLWQLTVAGANVNGTLAEPNGTLFRRITLRKDP